MELIIVIVILGVLAVTTAPRFLNIQESAREAVLEGVAGAMEGVITQVTSKAIIAGLDPDASNPGDQSNYVIDFGIGSVEVDWGNALPREPGRVGRQIDDDRLYDFVR
ncbi:hypothetical protein OAQ_02270 [Vibrio cyclitrophicus ZF30]|nr:hypothetical protein OAQ_02270 [Vibrio cyclitrophicus ZF30]OEE16091.1 hypothetical protein OC1_12155 [Vibrio cyclitrophicus ZF207]PME26631.1 hypothetical protein BCV41_13140 [Vibrio cyclitrophicus]PMJ33413.1 hypothetical protein BCU25_11480 [Vibrio cyclitrophicus]PMP50901.1 hypothetical protein BCS84_04685 [Vibrio cyclitrophicus]